MASSNFPNRPFRLQDTVWLISQNVAGNYSTVRAQLHINKNSYSPTFSTAASDYTFFINGAQVAGNQFTYDFRNMDSLMIANVDVNIPHNADGTKPSIAIDAYANVALMGYTELHSSIPLPTIPRTSNATFSPSNTFDAGTSVTINTNRASSSFTHDINYYFGTLGPVTIANNVGTSTTWTPPLSMLSQIPTSTSGNGIIRTNTKSGSSLIGQTDTQFFLRAPASVVPTVTTPSATEQNSTVSSVVGALVQGLSSVKVAATGTGIYGSTIKSLTLTVDDIAVANNATVLLNSSGTVPVKASVVDSRGRTATSTRNLTVLPYTDPVITSFSARRATSGGTASSTGTYLRFDLAAAVASLTNGTQRNGMKISIRTRPSEGAWTARNVINPTGLTYASGGLITGGSVYPISTSFEVEVTVEDNLGRTFIALTTVSTSAVTMDLNGQAVGIGKFHEEGALDVGGEIFQNGERVVAVDTIDADMPMRLASRLSGQSAAFTDWDDVTTSGWWYGGNKLNAPVGSTASWMGEVIAQSSTYVIQTLCNFTTGTQTAAWYRRRMRVGVWGPWEKIYSTDGEIETLLGNSAWTNLTLASGWGDYASETGSYRIKNGICYLAGRVSGTAAAGATIATLPTNARHTYASAMVFNTHSDNGSTIMLAGSDGIIAIASRVGLVRTGVSLAGISFPVG